MKVLAKHVETGEEYECSGPHVLHDSCLKVTEILEGNWSSQGFHNIPIMGLFEVKTGKFIGRKIFGSSEVLTGTRRYIPYGDWALIAKGGPEGGFDRVLMTETKDDLDPYSASVEGTEYTRQQGKLVLFGMLNLTPLPSIVKDTKVRVQDIPRILCNFN